MLLTVPILVGILYLYIETENSILCASIWGILTFFLGAIFHGFGLDLFLGSCLSFLIALGVFSLLNYVKGIWWWLAAIGGIFVLLFIA